MSVFSNRTCLALSGVLAGFGESFILPLIIVSAYVLYLTDNWYVIGSTPALAFGLRSLGALIGSWSLQNARRRKPWMFGAHLLRTGSIALIAWIAWREGVLAEDRLRTFLVTYGFFSFFSGVASSTTTSVVRMATDPGSRKRIFAFRAILAAASGIIAGLVIHELFSVEGQSIDRSFALLFIAASAAMATSAFLVLLVREQPSHTPRSIPSPGGTPAHSRSLKIFRKYVLVRVLLVGAGASDVFLVAFAFRELSFGFPDLGYCVIAFCGTMVAGLLIWSFIGESVLARSILQVGAVAKVVPPLIVVTVPLLEDSAYYQEHATAATIGKWAIVVAFGALGISGASIASGGYAFLTSVSSNMAPSLASTCTAVLAPFSLLAIAGGWIIDKWGFDTLFAVGLALSIVSLLATGSLPVTARRQPQRGAGVSGSSAPPSRNRFRVR